MIVPKCEKVERRVLSVEEQEIFLEYLERTKSWYEEMYKFMLLTGMRVGEIGGFERLHTHMPYATLLQPDVLKRE